MTDNTEFANTPEQMRRDKLVEYGRDPGEQFAGALDHEFYAHQATARGVAGRN